MFLIVLLCPMVEEAEYTRSDSQRPNLYSQIPS